MEVDPVPVLLCHDNERLLPAVREIKNSVIGNNKQKSASLAMIPRLLELMLEDTTPLELKIECAIVLGSIAKGDHTHVQALVDSGAISVLLQDIFSPFPAYVTACLRCLRTLLSSPLVSAEVMYQDPSIIPHLLQILHTSASNQQCVTAIIHCSCQTPEHQAILCSSGAISALATLLCNTGSTPAREVLPHPRVLMPTLRCFSQLIHNNSQVAQAIAAESYNGELLPAIFARLLQRDKPYEMQIQAAKCLTYLYRAGALQSTDTIIKHKALSTLVRMCSRERSWEERVEGALTLAYLTELDVELQRTAAISDHLISTLADYFRYNGSNADSSKLVGKVKDEVKVGNELRQAAFQAYAAISANDEEIRKKVLGECSLMDYVVNGLSDPVTQVQVSALRCLHSLSRSVQLLRTSLHDHRVTDKLIKILQLGQPEVLPIVSATLCNLVLEFSPSKDTVVESGAIATLVDLTKATDVQIRLNAIWALMNMTFQTDQKLRSDVVSALGIDRLFSLLCDKDSDVLLKTLGLLRNLLSSKPHIDEVMMLHGSQVIQAVILILEGDHPPSVKDQALCILANVADGDTSKDFIMGNEDVLKKLTTYMMHNDVKLQMAATFCVCNLIWSKNEGASERQHKLKELGIKELLQQLMHSSESALFDKAKSGLQQFC